MSDLEMQSPGSIRTRFAPSPTGQLHIGGARTALFNLLFSRHHGGQFLLRIEDTDRERSTPANTQVILDALAWLDIQPDEPPVFQSARQVRHAEVAHAMLAAGHAYRCYTSAEELREMRERAMAEGRPPRYDGRWRDRDPGDAPPGVQPVIRLKAAQAGDTVVEDLVQGTVRVANSELDDMIILRSDGTPTYLHAVVVDDHDMRISHVIRGDDHMTNTFRQIQVYQAMGWDLPRFAHLPLIHGPDGGKLSKRHGATSVLDFQQQGILPEAMCNVLLRLGWGHGDAEVLDRDGMVRLFDMDGVGKSAARLDPAKVANLSAVWLRRADDGRLTQAVVQRLQDGGLPVDATAAARIYALMPGLKERAKTLVDLSDSAAFLARAIPLTFETRALEQLTPEAKAALPPLAEALAATDFTAPALDAALRAHAEQAGRKLGQVAQPLRAALTGSMTSPPIDLTLAALGRDEALARIAAAAA